MGNENRHYVFLAFTLIFLLVLSGIISPFLSVPLVLVALVVVYNCRFEQVPRGYLRKFDQLFGLNISAEKGALTVKTGGKDIPLHRVILHRGGCIDTPENTLEAIREVGCFVVVLLSCFPTLMSTDTHYQMVHCKYHETFPMVTCFRGYASLSWVVYFLHAKYK
jgi:hypothetical protein